MEKELIQLYLEDKVSESSIKSYLIALRKIARVKKITSLDFLYDVETVMENITKNKNKPASDNTIKGRLTAILTTCRVLNTDKELINTYRKHHDEMKKKLQVIEESGEKNDKQIAYYMTNDELNTVSERLKAKAEGAKSTFAMVLKFGYR